jgi:xanthine dehydrogenase accessory factor
VEILTEPLPEEGSEMFRAVLELKDEGRRGTLVTILTDHPQYPDGKRKMLLCDDGSIVGSLGDSALEAFVMERGWDVLQGEDFAVVDYHVSFFIVRAAKLAGFKVKVIDDRPAFANKERFPQADDTMVMEFDEVRDAFDFGQDDYVVLVTRGHQHDQQILEQIYDCNARYLGMIGSKSKISKMWQRLEAKGIDASYLERVHAPIGLNIGADNPEEISISVVAELIMERRLGKVKRTRRKRSHDKRRDAVTAKI